MQREIENVVAGVLVLARSSYLDCQTMLPRLCTNQPDPILENSYIKQYWAIGAVPKTLLRSLDEQVLKKNLKSIRKSGVTGNL